MEQKQAIHEQAQLGVPPSILRENLQRLNAHTVTHNQITSAISEAKRQYEHGRTDTEVLRAQLGRPGTFHKVRATSSLRY